MTEAVAGRPTRVAGATATAVALLAALPVGAAAPGALVLALVGGGLLAAAVPWLDHDDPRRTAAASVALVLGGVLTALAAASADPLAALVSVTAAGVAVFAAGLGAAGYATSDDLTRLLVGLVANFGVLAVGAVAAAVVHVGAPAALLGVVGPVVDWLAGLGAANLAAAVAMAAFEAATLVALGHQAARATPAGALPGDAADAAGTLAAVEEALEGRAPWLALVGLLTGVVALLAPVLPVLEPLVAPAPAALAAATRPLHAAAWTLAVALVVYLVGLWLARALRRRSPTWLARRSVGAAGGLTTTALVAVVLAVVPLRTLAATVVGPETVVGVVDAAASFGAATLVLVLVAGALVPATTTVVVVLFVVGARLVPERGAGAAIASLLLFAGALGAAASGSVAGALLGSAAAFVVWDAGEHAASLGAHVGRAGRSRRAELVHVGAGVGVGVLGVLVGALAIPVAVLVSTLARPGFVATALVLLLVAVLALVSLVRG